MQNTVTITGLVATTPRHLVTQDGLPITSFRIAVTNSNRPGNIATSWFTVTSFHQLAINASASITKGNRIIVSGVLTVREWDNGETSGSSAEIDASVIAHDLNFGTSVYTRTTALTEVAA